MSVPRCFGEYHGAPDKLSDFIACNGGATEAPCLVRSECSVVTRLPVASRISGEPTIEEVRAWLADNESFGITPLAHYRPDLLVDLIDPRHLAFQVRKESRTPQQATGRSMTEMERRKTITNKFILKLISRIAREAGLPVSLDRREKERFAITWHSGGYSHIGCRPPKKGRVLVASIRPLLLRGSIEFTINQNLVNGDLFSDIPIDPEVANAIVEQPQRMDGKTRIYTHKTELALRIGFVIARILAATMEQK